MHFDGLPEHTDCRECMRGRCSQHGVFITLTADELLETVRNHMQREERLELDSMYLVTLLDQLRQISAHLSVGLDDMEMAQNAIWQAKTITDQLRVRISKDLRQVQETEAQEMAEMKEAFTNG